MGVACSTMQSSTVYSQPAPLILKLLKLVYVQSYCFCLLYMFLSGEYLNWESVPF